MEEHELGDFCTDTYLLERVRKFELDQREADAAAYAALWRGFRSAVLCMLFLAGVVYAGVQVYNALK